MHREYDRPLAPKAPVTLMIALTVYVAWTLATYLLEGRLLTLLRPEAVQARAAYAVVANLVIGVVVGAVVLRRLVRTDQFHLRDVGLRSRRYTAASIAWGFLLGILVFSLQHPPTDDLVIILNAFAQVWVVSAAEIVVCWALLGVAVEAGSKATSSRAARIGIAWVVAAVAFGLYHLAHSPPFNTVRMVGLLTVVGLVTGAYFFRVRELYGTIVFHNFLGLTGVARALAESDGLEQFGRLQMPLILMALATTGVLVGLDVLFVRRSSRTSIHA